MTHLAIQSIGAFTSVGVNAGQVMGSLHTTLQLFDDLDVRGADGEFVTGAAAPIDRSVTGVARLKALALTALQECAGKPGQDQRCPILLCAPSAEDVGGSYEGLLDDLADNALISLESRRSRVLAGGRASIAAALGEAQLMLRSGRIDRCIVGGVDSLIVRERVKRLLKQGRVRDAKNRDAFIPGEGAVFLKLAAREDPGTLAVIRGIGSDDREPSVLAGPPVIGRALAGAIAAALADADVPMAQVDYICHNVSGEQAFFHELSVAIGRLSVAPGQTLDLFAPAICVGDIGAAAGCLSLAMLAFSFDKGLRRNPAIASFQSDDVLRGAAVVAPCARGGKKRG